MALIEPQSFDCELREQSVLANILDEAHDVNMMGDRKMAYMLQAFITRHEYCELRCQKVSMIHVQAQIRVYVVYI